MTNHAQGGITLLDERRLTHTLQNAKRVIPEGAPDRDTMWAICEGNISLEDLVLVRVDNVSKGSWQPQLLVNRRHRN